MNNITFTPMAEVAKEYYPAPASKYLPEWYKKQQSYINNKKEVSANISSQTIKKCVPVFDAITAGYIIPLYTDVYVKQENGYPYFSWSSLGAIQFHSPEQIDSHPKNNSEMGVPKFLNHFSIKLPKGYSALFVPPMHRPNDIFYILEGVVDCDTYTAQVNFPFILNNPKFEGLIPAGTPIAQIIPFKRQQWQMEIGNDIEEINEVHKKRNAIYFDFYKYKMWHKKEFK
jgi:hypothetical protein